MKIIVPILFLLIITSVSCSTYKNNTSYSKMKLHAEGILKDKIEYKFNTDSTMVICVGNKKKSNLYYSFFIYSLSENKKLSKVFNHIEKVFWKNNFEVKYSPMMGTVQKGGGLPIYRTISLK